LRLGVFARLKKSSALCHAEFISASKLIMMRF
jgi:hypothetical protein